MWNPEARVATLRITLCVAWVLLHGVDRLPLTGCHCMEPTGYNWPMGCLLCQAELTWCECTVWWTCMCVHIRAMAYGCQPFALCKWVGACPPAGASSVARTK